MSLEIFAKAEHTFRPGKTIAFDTVDEAEEIEEFSNDSDWFYVATVSNDAELELEIQSLNKLGA